MMKRIMLFFACVFISITAFATPYKQVIVFGDSLSDNGNLYRIDFHTLPKSPPYFEGRFSNGPTWAEYLGQYFADHYQAKYKIYALGGAALLFQSTKNMAINPSTLDMQINQYIVDSSAGPKDDVLYVIWIGGNDYLMDASSDVDKLTTKAIAKHTDDMQRLIKHGAKHFLILNLPDLSLTPLARDGRPVQHLAALSSMHNAKLALSLEKLKQENKVDITLFDIYALFNEAINHPDKFNKRYNTHVTNTQDMCWQGGFTLDQSIISRTLAKELQMKSQQYKEKSSLSLEAVTDMIMQNALLKETYQLGLQYDYGIKPCENPDDYAFWDAVHPTAVVHRVLAQIIEETI